MSKLDRVYFAAFLTLLGFSATAASAATEAYLKNTGTGTTCTLSTPCASMTAALGVAGAGGEVICLDKGAYSVSVTFNISQSVTISCGDGLWEAPHAQINITTPAGAEVVIEGLVLDAETSGCCNIEFTGAGTLRLRRVRSGNLTGSSSNGLRFAPSGAGVLSVTDSVFYNNGASGILVRPSGNGYANVHIRNTRFERNAHGLFVDGSTSTTGINVNISQSMAVQNQGNGIGAYSPAGGAPVTVSLKDSHISGNIVNGLGVLSSAASGAGSAVITVGGTMITTNVNGVSASGAGQIRTHGNNQLQSNGNNGVFTGNVGLQ